MCDELLELFYQQKNPVDVYLTQIQEKYYRQCFVVYPNIIINKLDSSDVYLHNHN
jgi:hypothetical protein